MLTLDLKKINSQKPVDVDLLQYLSNLGLVLLVTPLSVTEELSVALSLFEGKPVTITSTEALVTLIDATTYFVNDLKASNSNTRLRTFTQFELG